MVGLARLPMVLFTFPMAALLLSEPPAVLQPGPAGDGAKRRDLMKMLAWFRYRALDLL